MELHTTNLYRFLQSESNQPCGVLGFNYVDENRKHTVVKYRLCGIVESRIFEFGKRLVNYIWRLDARSTRHMKRVNIIENKKSGGLINVRVGGFMTIQ